MKLLSLFLVLIFTNSVFADAPVHGFSKKAQKWMAEQNRKQSQKSHLVQPIQDRESENFLPYGEYEDQGYLIFSDETYFNSLEAKKGFLENLPPSITPVIFTQNQSPEYVQSLKERFGSLLEDPERLKIMYLSDSGNSFWARDNIPVPVFQKTIDQEDKDSSNFVVIDAKYYYHFEPDQEVADKFSAKLESHEYYFEGGNFVANAVGDCLVVETSRVEEMPNSIFSELYGCKNLMRLPYLRGIGHADESVKFISDDTVLTDLDEYEEILEEEGFNVVRIPKARGYYETYLNSVILEDTIYMPAYGNELDEEAMNVYRSLGYNPIPLESSTLSNRGQGSLHCISMVYPKVSYQEFKRLTGAEEI